MRIIVCSDTHGDFDALYHLVEKEKASTDLFIHLGDGEAELDDLRAVFPALPLLAVRGNCDFYSTAPIATSFCQGNPEDANAVRLFLTHGNTYRVGESLIPLIHAARTANAEIALFGHTHRKLVDRRDGLWLCNPGSLARPRDSGRSYAVIEKQNGILSCYHKAFL